ncbi:hypothetical protein BTU51_0989 [Rickettsia rickettsii]|uniref:Uncharacterized protein n=1 Tax=Rickettsia rickettsii (strain Iowa) TaxID=452659 RepID=B0BY80_RICRO|nr:hypothetical protein RrIowa_0989 [Rickettsia rickettsii str. Iowa]APU55756.1 hypothetical protein BTU50_0989 [Rickettsia rickettsii]APU57133.1 hypothetical protein BTU51_0989 [Rickettsia rickettsii]
MTLTGMGFALIYKGYHYPVDIIAYNNWNNGYCCYI